VTKKKPTNTAASVRARLLRVAKEGGEDFQYVLTRYALERLMVRLVRSAHRDVFLLKGAMLFRAWSPTMHRPTKDLDLLGNGAPDLDRLAGIFRDVCGVQVEDDGVTFDPKGVAAEQIKEDADYEGVRVTMRARIGTAKLDLQIDVGFGDAVTPEATEIDFPTLLDAEPLRIRAYPRETVVAEKVEAMVHLGIANSRMKDFFDIWFLARNFAFEGRVLSAALRATFVRRGTSIPAVPPVALTAAFAADASKMAQWKAFVARAGLARDVSLADVVEAVAGFARPPLEAAREARPFSGLWAPLGPWRSG
jgi:predicted nucleotidyltransferase component of viral defense system